MAHRIDSQRLIHQQLNAADEPQFLNLISNTDVLRYCFEVPCREEAQTQFQSRLLPWSMGAAHWLCLSVTLKDSNKFIGICGFRRANGFVDSNVDSNVESNAMFSAELGFMFLPDFHSKGYATESVKAVINYAKQLGIKNLCANVTEGNAASCRVLEKCHFTLVDTQENAITIYGKTYKNLCYSLLTASDF